MIIDGDREWSLAVLERDNHTCRWCGANGEAAQVAAHHLIKRRFTKYRHNLDNGLTLCWQCHRYMEDHPVEAKLRAKLVLYAAGWSPDKVIKLLGRGASCSIKTDGSVESSLT